MDELQLLDQLERQRWSWLMLLIGNDASQQKVEISGLEHVKTSIELKECLERLCTTKHQLAEETTQKEEALQLIQQQALSSETGTAAFKAGSLRMSADADAVFDTSSRRAEI